MANRVTLKISGGAEAAKNAQRFANMTAPNAIAQGVYLEGNNIMTASKRRTPVDVGALKGSGYVTLPEMRGSRILVELGYGGPAADYAEVQHERTELHHEVGEAKFLEKSLDERAPRLARNIAAIANRAIKRGTVGSPTQAPGMPTDPWTMAVLKSLTTAFRGVRKQVQRNQQKTSTRTTRAVGRTRPKPKKK